jgi:hypothetical protein
MLSRVATADVYAVAGTVHVMPLAASIVAAAKVTVAQAAPVVAPLPQ